MAIKTVVELVDDLDGGQAAETVSFSLDGVTYTIDLSAQNATRLRDVLAEFVAGARRATNRARRIIEAAEDSDVSTDSAAATKAERKRANREALKSIRAAARRTAAAVKAAQGETESIARKSPKNGSSEPATEIKITPVAAPIRVAPAVPTSTTGDVDGVGDTDGHDVAERGTALIVPFQTAGG